MKRAGSIAAAVGAALVGLVLVGGSVAQASPAPARPDPLSPLRDFVATVPTTPAPLASLNDEERVRLDRVTAARPQLPPSGLDALRHAAATPSAPGGR